MSKAKFDAAKELIETKHYNEARGILKTIDHPTARAWEAKLDKLDPPYVPDEPKVFNQPAAPLPPIKTKPIPKRNPFGCRNVLIVTAAIFLAITLSRMTDKRTPSEPTPSTADVAMVATSESQVTIIPTTENRSGFVTMTPGEGTVYPTATITETHTPTVAPTMTMVPNATVTPRPASLSKPPEMLLTDAINQVSRVNLLSVKVADGRANGGERVAIIAYTTQTVDPDTLVGEMATILGALAVAFTQNDLDIDSASLIFGPNENETAGIVAVQGSDLINYGNGVITAEELFGLLTFTSLTDSSASSSGVRSAPVQTVSQVIPNNCDEAVAMGLTAAQAGQYSHLDRDDDGVACYGD